MLTTQIPSDAEKTRVWDAYRAGKPVRVPMTLITNARVVLQDPQLNEGGLTFEAAAKDPRTHVEVALLHARYLRTTLHQVCDSPTEFPEVWHIGMNVYNVVEAAQLGAPVEFTPGQVPATEPILHEHNRRDVFKIDIDHPLDHGYLKDCLDFWHRMDDICRGMTFEGRPVELDPWAILATDGPFTVACNLRGSDFLTDLIEDPQYADELMTFITDAAIKRRAAFYQYWGDRLGKWNGLADDSITMLGPQMYVERVLPHHRRFLDTGPTEPQRFMHLCGNASHLFPTIHRELKVMAFDTGFPIDHGKIRRELGPAVEILGGPPVDLLMNGTPNAVYERTREILLSGVKEGGRFVLREGNNLPPRTPLENLKAMYEACLEHGWY